MSKMDKKREELYKLICKTDDIEFNKTEITNLNCPICGKSIIVELKSTMIILKCSNNDWIKEWVFDKSTGIIPIKNYNEIKSNLFTRHTILEMSDEKVDKTLYIKKQRLKCELKNG